MSDRAGLPFHLRVIFKDTRFDGTQEDPVSFDPRPERGDDSDLVDWLSGDDSVRTFIRPWGHGVDPLLTPDRYTVREPFVPPFASYGHTTPGE